MSFTNSPNMNLPIPTVGGEPGPNYATDVNSSLTLVDGTIIPQDMVFKSLLLDLISMPL